MDATVIFVFGCWTKSCRLGSLLLESLRPGSINHRQSRKRNIDDYKSYFGFKPVIHAQLWEDLQTTDIVEARIDITTPKGNVSIENLLWSQYFLKTYCTDKQRKGPTGHCEETGRK